MGEFFGFISALCFGFCALPQSIKCIQDKSASGISNGMIFLWILGEFSAIIYAIVSLNSPFWLLLNYALSCLTLLPIIYYKVKK
jgi:uncharacterized protein with PQ loop repeat